MCRFCADGFNDFSLEECCGDPVLNTLCQSFVQNTISLVEGPIDSHQKRAVKGKFMLGKKNRNTFLGKRAHPSDKFEDDEYDDFSG